MECPNFDLFDCSWVFIYRFKCIYAVANLQFKKLKYYYAVARFLCCCSFRLYFLWYIMWTIWKSSCLLICTSIFWHHIIHAWIWFIDCMTYIQYLMVENTQLILSMAHIFSRTNCIQSQLLLTIFHTINSLKFHQMSKLSVLLATSDWICHFHGRILSGRCAYNVSMQFLVEFKGNRQKINSWSFVLITKYIKLKLNLSTQKFRSPSDTQ